MAQCRRVLVVDDDADGRESLRLLLEVWGHEVVVAETGTRAIELASRCEPEVVFLDIGMPGMDGCDVARHLRAAPGGGKALLVALTGGTSDGTRRAALEAGFDTYVMKPASIVPTTTAPRWRSAPARRLFHAIRLPARQDIKRPASSIRPPHRLAWLGQSGTSARLRGRGAGVARAPAPLHRPPLSHTRPITSRPNSSISSRARPGIACTARLSTPAAASART